jgi:hypothetical protein
MAVSVAWLIPLLPAIITGLAALGGVVVAWALREWSEGVSRSRDDKRASGPVLVDLLVIYNNLWTVNDEWEAFQKQAGGDPADWVAHRDKIEQLGGGTNLMQVPDFQGHVDELARQDPVLAFEVRKQTLLLSPLLRRLRSLSATDPQAAAFWGELEPRIMATGLTKLRDVIPKVARVHGPRTYTQVRCSLEQGVSDDGRRRIDEFRSQVRQAQARALGPKSR